MAVYWVTVVVQSDEVVQGGCGSIGISGRKWSLGLTGSGKSSQRRGHLYLVLKDSRGNVDLGQPGASLSKKGTFSGAYVGFSGTHREQAFPRARTRSCRDFGNQDRDSL